MRGAHIHKYHKNGSKKESNKEESKESNKETQIVLLWKYNSISHQKTHPQRWVFWWEALRLGIPSILC